MASHWSERENRSRSAPPHQKRKRAFPNRRGTFFSSCHCKLRTRAGFSVFPLSHPPLVRMSLKQKKPSGSFFYVGYNHRGEAVSLRTNGTEKLTLFFVTKGPPKLRLPDHDHRRGGGGASKSAYLAEIFGTMARFRFVLLESQSPLALPRFTIG